MLPLTQRSQHGSDRPLSATVSVEYAAAMLGLGRNTVYCAIRRGELPVLRIGRRIVVRRATLERLLADPDGLPQLNDDHSRAGAA